MTTMSDDLHDQPRVPGRVEKQQHLYELVVGADIGLFPLAWVPMQTARAVHERAASGATANDAGAYVVALTKVFHDTDGDRNESLTAMDKEFLHRVWGYLPPLQLPVSESLFEPYWQAFREMSGPPLPFELEPMLSNLDSAVAELIRETEPSHLALLKSRVLDGTLVPLDGTTRVPVPGKWHPDAVLTLEALRNFAGSLSIDVKVAQPSIHGGGDVASFGTQVEKRRYLLQEFKRLGGVVTKDGTRSGLRGALAALHRADGRSPKSVTQQLDKAITEEAAERQAAASANIFAGLLPKTR